VLVRSTVHTDTATAVYILRREAHDTSTGGGHEHGPEEIRPAAAAARILVPFRTRRLLFSLLDWKTEHGDSQLWHAVRIRLQQDSSTFTVTAQTLPSLA